MIFLVLLLAAGAAMVFPRLLRTYQHHLAKLHPGEGSVTGHPNLVKRRAGLGAVDLHREDRA